MSVVITPELAQRIVALINGYHAATAGMLYGEDAISKEQWEEASRMGIVDPLVAEKMKSANPTEVFRVGCYLGHKDHATWQTERYGHTAEEMLAEIEKNPIPMTEVEHQASVFSARESAQYIVGLGNKAGATLGSSLIEADKALDRELRTTIQDVVSSKFGDNDAMARMKARAKKLGLEHGGDKTKEFFDDSFRSSTKRMASDMGHATKDWSRDFDRIAKTEAQRALNAGLKASWEAQEEERAKADKKPIDPTIVYKIPKTDACKQCNKHHLDSEGNPKLFHLGELEGNGVNVGRKVADWKPVVGPLHPFCACALVRLPLFLPLPKNWQSGQSAPKLIGPGGALVLDEDDTDLDDLEPASPPAGGLDLVFASAGGA